MSTGDSVPSRATHGDGVRALAVLAIAGCAGESDKPDGEIVERELSCVKTYVDGDLVDMCERMARSVVEDQCAAVTRTVVGVNITMHVGSDDPDLVGEEVETFSCP